MEGRKRAGSPCSIHHVKRPNNEKWAEKRRLSRFLPKRAAMCHTGRGG